MFKSIRPLFITIGLLSSTYLKSQETSPFTVTASDLSNGQITFTAHATVNSLFSVEIEFTELTNLRPSKEGKLIFNLDGNDFTTSKYERIKATANTDMVGSSGRQFLRMTVKK
jgi:hypothetical protein